MKRLSNSGFRRLQQLRELFQWICLSAAALCWAFFLYSCGGGKVVEPVLEESATEFDRLGWYNFQKGNYEEALLNFNRANAIDKNSYDPYNGLGWAFLRMLNLTDSERNFIVATALDSLKVEPIVGNIFVLFEKNKYTDAINLSNRLFKMDSTKFLGDKAPFVFKYDSKVTARKIHKVVALSYFYLGNFAKSYNHLRLYLNSQVELNPNEPGFPQKLLEELKKL